MKRFIGREEELELLRSFLGKQSASFLVIRGRRRIGKSRLIEEFSKGMPCAIFSGLPPDEATTRETQLAVFARRMAKIFTMPKIKVDDWAEMFWHLDKQTAEGRIVLVFDEISWIGSKDPTFLGYLKEAWDRHFSKNPELIFIVCGILMVLGALLMGGLIRRRLTHPVKGQPYECGEPAIGQSWVQFDLRFYVVALVFIIFDVEIALFYPWAVVYRDAGIAGLWDMLFFFGVLVIGFLFLWRFGYLDWVRASSGQKRDAAPGLAKREVNP